MLLYVSLADDQTKLICVKFKNKLLFLQTEVMSEFKSDDSAFCPLSRHLSVFVMQVTKLIEESTVSKSVKNAIDTDKLLDWLVENSVLSIALEGEKSQRCQDTFSGCRCCLNASCSR